jgi:dihydropyrimidinase
VVTPAGVIPASVRIVDGSIQEVGDLDPREGEDAIDVSGLVVMPGAVDLHTHMELRVLGVDTADDWETGSVAALFGGVTTVIDFAEPDASGSLLGGLAAARARAAGHAVVDHGFHMTVTEAAVERLDELAEVARLGTTSVKVYLAYPGRYLLDDAKLRRTLASCADLGLLVMVHAETGLDIEARIAAARQAGTLAPAFHAATRPPETEALAVEQVVAAAAETGAAVILAHLSTAGGVAAVARAKAAGLPVYGETCPHYLWLEAHRLGWEAPAGLLHVCAPPLRTVDHLHALHRGLIDGTLDEVSTDHCPFDWWDGKSRGLGESGEDFTATPGGLPGVETRLPLLYAAGVATGRFGLERFVDLVSTAPARLAGLAGRKGVISAGADADLVIFDPDGWTSLSSADLHMNVDHSPYEGMTAAGKVVGVIRAGVMVVWNDQIRAKLPPGSYLARTPRPRP